MQYLYVCHFSNGHIKVGRSSDPKSRIAQHEERVSCLGVELVEHVIKECVSHVIPAETALINRCAAVAVRQNKNEWFVGLDFPEVCGWLVEAADATYTLIPAALAATDKELIQSLGGPAKVADLLKLTGQGRSQRVHNWMTRGIPAQIKVDFPRIFMRKRKPD